MGDHTFELNVQYSYETSKDRIFSEIETAVFKRPMILRMLLKLRQR